METKKKILIIEDEKPMAKALELKLNNSGFIATAVFNGQEGMNLIEKNKFDLILIDLVMPRMDGITFLRKLKKEQAGKNIPIIILTNLGDSNNVAEALNEGSFNYLIKTDWTLEEIVQKVKRTIVNN